jgi:hypothetical protein
MIGFSWQFKPFYDACQFLFLPQLVLSSYWLRSQHCKKFCPFTNNTWIRPSDSSGAWLWLRILALRMLPNGNDPHRHLLLALVMSQKENFFR